MVGKYITKEEVNELAQKVRDLEKNTSVEIVSMMVSKSSATGHVFWILFLAFLSLFFEANVFLFSFLTELQQGLALIAELVVGGVLSFILSRYLSIQRLLTRESDMAAQVAQRAQVEFYNQNLTSTAGRTGILLFVSLMEHRVVILADKSISEKLPKETWTEVVNNLILDIKTARLSVGIKKAVEHVSKLVTPLFPAQDSNPNELTDYLIIEDSIPT